MHHVVSVKQFLNTNLLDDLFASADRFRDIKDDQYPDILRNKIIAHLFYEPSTRTRFSFEAATLRLGGKVISTENGSEFSSASKGETLEDTIRTVNCYADGIVMRHPQVGSAKAAALVSDVPVINAGDGGGEHPTQALLDMYTISRAKKSLDGLNIGLVGDLRYGRTVHSLIYLLAEYGASITFIAPEDLQVPVAYTKYLDTKDVKYQLVSNWDKSIGDLDVIYMTRIQKERFEHAAEYERLKHSFELNKSAMGRVKKDTVVMHPLPRVTEIAPEIDDDPRAIYFQQAKNGLFVRMALLEMLLTPAIDKLPLGDLQTV